MLASLEFLQTGWLAAAVIVVIGAALALVALRTKLPVTSGATAHLSGSRWRLLRPVLIAASAALAVLWLARTGTLAGQLMLAVLAIGAGIALAALYLARFAASRLVRMWLIVARGGALALLLLIIVRPQWGWTEHSWQKPLLVMLIDDSESMKVVDAGAEKQSRAERAAQALAAAPTALDAAREKYRVDIRYVSDFSPADPAAPLRTSAPVTALAAALRSAAELRAESGDPPAALVLISDGRETADNDQQVRDSAALIRDLHTALFALAVGPQVGSVELELEPLAVPERIGARERMHVPVIARVSGLNDVRLTVQLLWNGVAAAEQAASAPGTGATALRADFDTQAPGPGLHRLTARVALPEKLGGGVFERSAIIDARDERIRVLYVDAAPRSETGFVTRAWAGDERLEVTRQLWAGVNSAGTLARATERPKWDAYDVIVLGGIPGGTGSSDLRAIADCVRVRGAGLLLAAGPELFNNPAYSRSTLAEVSPVRFADTALGDKEPFQVRPTDAGLGHPALHGVAVEENAAQPSASRDVERSAWTGMPSLAGAAIFGEPRPLAEVLARDENDRPVMVAHEIGAGRVLAAAWESTWPWALASDAGFQLHRRLWRQMIVWLANKHPRLWILTDDTQYALAALQSGQRPIRVRAGLSGADFAADSLVAHGNQLRLRMKPAGAAAPVLIPLARAGDEFRAEIRGSASIPMRAGPCELELDVIGDKPGAVLPASASTRFDISDVSPELHPPTSNFGLLREAAELSRASGGRFQPVTALRTVLLELAQHDRRTKIERAHVVDPADQFGWGLLVAPLALLALEWVLRKRAGGF